MKSIEQTNYDAGFADGESNAAARIEALEEIVRSVRGLLDHVVFDDDEHVVEIKQAIRACGLEK
jgi:hypothetical protein